MITNLARGVRAFTSNAFLVEGERTALVDTGSNFDAVEMIEEQTGDLDAIVLTHTHPDHVGNLQEIKDAFDVESWGFDPEQGGVDHAIADDETVRLGDHEYVALHTPGHKNDHLCFFAAGQGVLFAGDLIFQNGGFGRTDLPEGDRETLIASIDRIKDEIDGNLRELHCGHGPSVTNDPFQDVELASQAARMG